MGAENVLKLTVKCYSKVGCYNRIKMITGHIKTKNIAINIHRSLLLYFKLIKGNFRMNNKIF